jgi:hypothetical protein
VRQLHNQAGLLTELQQLAKRNHIKSFSNLLLKKRRNFTLLLVDSSIGSLLAKAENPSRFPTMHMHQPDIRSSPLVHQISQNIAKISAENEDS